ncbi:hypothetical protein C8J56DRAFT_1063224 [Mycena floridula]|nr:hypothetical protein C8J56DRAFT_1063224 [Mycena floridula]
MTGSVVRLSFLLLAVGHILGCFAAPIGDRDAALHTRRLDSGDTSLNRRIVPLVAAPVAMKVGKMIVNNPQVQNAAIKVADKVGLPGSKIAGAARQVVSVAGPVTAVAGVVMSPMSALPGAAMKAGAALAKNPQVQNAAEQPVKQPQLPSPWSQLPNLSAEINWTFENYRESIAELD